MTEKSSPRPSAKNQNQGEGDYEADQRYRQKAEKHAGSEESEAGARRAEEALDSAEAPELAEAEERGRSRAKSTHDQRGEP